MKSSPLVALRRATFALAFLVPSLSAQKAIYLPDQEPARVGLSHPLTVDPDLATAYPTQGGYFWGDWVHVKDASFLKAHLVDVNLRKGDTLVLRSKTGKVIEEISGRGPKDFGTFWALSAFGDELFLELYFDEPYDYVPFRVDQVIVGDPDQFAAPDEPESICSPGDFEDVICYQGDAGKWSAVLASVGVMGVNGNPNSALFCSGSNVSPLNYLLTNDHCLGTQTDCNSTEFVFKFYRTGCNNGSPPTADWQSFRCDTLVAGSPFISCDQGLGDLDYSLSSVIGDPASTFGHVDPDPVAITDGEGIYIVQHPAGRPHEITHGSGANVDADGTVLRYYTTLDTEGGSSGSPIFREADDKLIGLHHCGGCTTPGVGNRGMLMSDIYPEIQSFLCSLTVDLRAAGASGMTEVKGNGDGVIDPGETWEFSLQVQNTACTATATGVVAEVMPSAGSASSVRMQSTSATFASIPGGTTGTSADTIRFHVKRDAPCGGVLTFDLTSLTATNGGPFGTQAGFLSESVGDDPVRTAFFDDFSGGPGAWGVVDGGTGVGPAQTWTLDNPGGRVLALTDPYYIVDSDELGSGQAMDEELLSPVVDLTGFANAELQFAHDFRYYSGGLAEQCDVDVRSSATGGAWVNVANFSGASTSGVESIDITAQAAGQSDVEIRFHYYAAVYEWWWAVDDVFVLGGNGFVCNVFGVDRDVTPLGDPIGGRRP